MHLFRNRDAAVSLAFLAEGIGHYLTGPQLLPVAAVTSGDSGTTEAVVTPSRGLAAVGASATLELAAGRANCGGFLSHGNHSTSVLFWAFSEWPTCSPPGRSRTPELFGYRQSWLRS